MTTYVTQARRGERGDNDHTVGCGQVPLEHQEGQPFKSGRICARRGTEPSCRLCPDSPTYWRAES